jgi:DNA-binding IclR family transcriptional regulator
MSTMHAESRHILSLMADGAHRSFDAISIKAQMDQKTVHATLDRLVLAGWLERERQRGYEAYLITIKGLIELQTSDGPRPLYRR